jgi:prevent-host-death family protein
MPSKAYPLDGPRVAGLGSGEDGPLDRALSYDSPPRVDMKTMDASKVRKSLARILEAVRDKEEPVVIVRYGQPMAALVPLKSLTPEERKKLDRLFHGGTFLAPRWSRSSTAKIKRLS